MDDDPLTDDRETTEAIGSERMWPLDFALAILGGLVIYTVVTRLDANDSRWLYNPMTYAVSVPMVVVALSLILRNVASRFVRRSLQLGFLLSALVHLILLLAFFNVIIFTPFWPSATMGVDPIRAPLRKTVPDYLFARSDLPQKQPDWSRPVDASTSSREVPIEERKLPPLDRVDQQLRQPQDQPQPETDLQPFLTPRPQPSAALPTPATSAGELARQNLRRTPSNTSAIEIPDVTIPDRAAAGARERMVETRPAESSPQAAIDFPNAGIPEPQTANNLGAEPQRMERRDDVGLPRVGELAMDAERRSRRATPSSNQPAGAEPSTPSLKFAKEAAEADKVLRDRAITPLTPSVQPGARLESAATGSGIAGITDAGVSTNAPLARNDSALAGQPQVSAGGISVASEERPGKTRRNLELPTGDLGVPDVSDLQMAGDRRGGSNQQGNGPARAIDRAEALLADARGKGQSEGAATGVDPTALGLPDSMATVDLMTRTGPAGLSADPSERIGFALATEMPDVASIDFGQPIERRRDLGGPVAPDGSEISGLRPFDRRTMRTSGGSAPTPAGLIGPESEEAIERGLAYLAERQNSDGSWSLQGHGEDVSMRSDTAATGLCLLAFQGAGYTHQQHQYADTVSRGLQFLLVHQQRNGDLYRKEDRASNANAWLYSHGIAALALCEAYGMTRDPELRLPAQRCIDFIASSQEPKYGGWRYEPRVSSDTSVTGWMMMALKSGELSGLDVSKKTYDGIAKWIEEAQESPQNGARYRYNPFAPNTEKQAHGRRVTPTMTAVGLLARLYLGWERSKPEMQQGADYLSQFPPAIGTRTSPRRDTYYWYYATQVMFHMGGEHWKDWNSRLTPMLVSSQLREGPDAGSWDPATPVPDRWGPHAGRVYVTAMNLLSLEVYYRHLPIYVETGK